eukprot:NODE_147_length_17537_cov_0.265627.p11 type:complete len:178 gc:universal NODE_147_length_17537_cov_0.265627:3094-3627(+)
MYYTNEPFQTQSHMSSKKRRRLNSDETKILQTIFEQNSKPDAMLRGALADRLGMTARNIQIWFQNRRAKTKKLKKDNVSDEESNSPTTAAEFASIFTQEFSPTEDSVVKSKAILPKVYYPSEVHAICPQPEQKEQKPATAQTPAGLNPNSKSFELSMDLFNEVQCNEFDFLNFLEDC